MKAPKPKATKPAAPRLSYSVNEAAEAISLSPRSVWTLIAKGKIETRKIGCRTVIPAQSLHSLLERAA